MENMVYMFPDPECKGRERRVSVMARTSETEDALLVHADDVDSGCILDVILESSICQEVLVNYDERENTDRDGARRKIGG